MITLVIILLVLLVILGWFYLESLADLAVAARNLAGRQAAIDVLRAQLAAATDDRHDISRSALRGCPLVKWTHPNPAPASDRWYWLGRFAGRSALFTAEAVDAAFTRGDLLIPAKH